MSEDHDVRSHCGRLSIGPCRAHRECMAWAEAREKRLRLAFVPRETAYSKACGKFVVPAW